MRAFAQFSFLITHLFALEQSYKYPYDPRIHNFGNVGIGGKIHANLARTITKTIDVVAYDGENIRNTIVKSLKSDAKTISDWCCGTGISTDALTQNFQRASVMAFDTSHEMLNVARKFSRNATFTWGDAENIRLPEPVDLITIMFAFHEIPQHGRIKILKNARDNLVTGGSLLLVDIDMDYTPSKMMLTGEPYVLDYIANVQEDIASVFPNVIEKVIIPGHVRQWLLPM